MTAKGYLKSFQVAFKLPVSKGFRLAETASGLFS